MARGIAWQSSTRAPRRAAGDRSWRSGLHGARFWRRRAAMSGKRVGTQAGDRQPASAAKRASGGGSSIERAAAPAAPWRGSPIADAARSKGSRRRAKATALGQRPPVSSALPRCGARAPGRGRGRGGEQCGGAKPGRMADAAAQRGKPGGRNSRGVARWRWRQRGRHRLGRQLDKPAPRDASARAPVGVGDIRASRPAAAGSPASNRTARGAAVAALRTACAAVGGDRGRGG